MKDMRVGIVGGGIGGLTLSVVLKKLGIAHELYEQAAEIKAVGAGIHLASNAMAVFEKLGIRENVQDAGHPIHHIIVTDNWLKKLMDSDLRDFHEKQKIGNIAIHRGALQHVLLTFANIEGIHLGKKLLPSSNPSEGILEFEDGTREEFDLVVGADGLNSTVRKILFPEARLRDAKQWCWRGISSGIPLGEYRYSLTEAWDAGHRFGFVPVNDHTFYWYAVIRSNLLKVNRQDWINGFKTFHPMVHLLAKATRPAAIHESELKDVRTLKSWSVGSCVLMGDAAHAATPNLGQGACQAIEDAWALGSALSEGTDLSKQISGYEKARMPKANAIVKRSRLIGEIAQLNNPLAESIRNTMLSILPHRFGDIQA